MNFEKCFYLKGLWNECFIWGRETRKQKFHFHSVLRNEVYCGISATLKWDVEHFLKIVEIFSEVKQKCVAVPITLCW